MKIDKYLNSKEKSEYNHVDKLFELYLSGDIDKILSEYAKVEIYPTINELGEELQLNYSFHNIRVVIDFFEDKYSVVVYATGTPEVDLKKLLIDYEYQEDFCLEELINEIDAKIKNHPKLKDNTIIKKRKKICSLIAWLAFSIPACAIGWLSLYCIITGETIQLNEWWVLLLLVIPAIVWFVFDITSERLK